VTADPAAIEDPIGHDEAEQLLGVSYMTLRRLLKAGKLRYGYRVPGSPTSGLLIDRRSVIDYRDRRDKLAAEMVNPPAAATPAVPDVLLKVQQDIERWANRTFNTTRPKPFLPEAVAPVAEEAGRQFAKMLMNATGHPSDIMRWHHFFAQTLERLTAAAIAAATAEQSEPEPEGDPAPTKKTAKPKPKTNRRK
jgi:hypothetical protein